MRLRLLVGALALVALAAEHLLAQERPANPASPAEPEVRLPWQFSFTIADYLLPDQDSYVNPNLAVDHTWLHLEARYNYENLRTGSLWVGYNFSIGKELELKVTPMIGGVFGRTAGIAPGCDASLSYKKLTFSLSNEYLFDLRNRAESFYYSWPELTYSPTDWLRVGLAAQRTKLLRTKLDTQRGFLVGLSHKQVDFTAYVFNLGWTDPTTVLEFSWSF